MISILNGIMRKQNDYSVAPQGSLSGLAYPQRQSLVLHLPPKKSRNEALKHPLSGQVALLTTLPFVVTRELLKYLDVDTLECLSRTCVYFDQLIAGEFLLSVDFPFPADLSADVAQSSKLEKKPLLKMRCKKTKGNMNSSSDLLPYKPISMHNIIQRIAQA